MMMMIRREGEGGCFGCLIVEFWAKRHGGGKRWREAERGRAGEAIERVSDFPDGRRCERENRVRPCVAGRGRGHKGVPRPCGRAERLWHGGVPDASGFRDTRAPVGNHRREVVPVCLRRTARGHADGFPARWAEAAESGATGKEVPAGPGRASPPERRNEWPSGRGCELSVSRSRGPEGPDRS